MRNIFVSSTFKDMQAERDIIRQKVFPAINKAAGCHNDHIEFCDLRWGIDTLNQNEQEASIKIMNVCLNELGRSDDLMVVLLGDRYGWIPGAGYLQKLQETQNITSKIECMSATAFEIEHGVFYRNKRALVYFRKIEDVGETGILFWKNDCEKVLSYLKQQKEIRSNISRPKRSKDVEENKEKPGSGKITYKEEIAPDGKSWYKGYWKNGLRDGFGEAKFPSSSSYKGEWKAGKPNGYGISTDYLGKVSCGVFENGELKKKLPKIIVSLKLGR